MRGTRDRRRVYLLRAPDGRLFYRLGYSVEDAVRSLARELGVHPASITVKYEGKQD